MPNTTYTYDLSRYQNMTDVAVNNGNIAGATIWTIIAAILSIVGGILLYCLFVKSKKEPKGKFVKALKDFLSFKTMWIETILKVLYYMGTIFCMLFSFTFIGTSFMVFICLLVVAPVIIRLAYEAAIMFTMIWRNTKDIADNTHKKA